MANRLWRQYTGGNGPTKQDGKLLNMAGEDEGIVVVNCGRIIGG
jgi:hypothetical protein